MNTSLHPCVLPCVPTKKPRKIIYKISIKIYKKPTQRLTFNNMGTLKALSHIEHLYLFSDLCLKRICFILATLVVDTKPQISHTLRLSELSLCILRK